MSCSVHVYTGYGFLLDTSKFKKTVTKRLAPNPCCREHDGKYCPECGAALTKTTTENVFDDLCDDGDDNVSVFMDYDNNSDVLVILANSSIKQTKDVMYGSFHHVEVPLPAEAIDQLDRFCAEYGLAPQHFEVHTIVEVSC